MNWIRRLYAWLIGVRIPTDDDVRRIRRDVTIFRLENVAELDRAIQVVAEAMPEFCAGSARLNTDHSAEDVVRALIDGASLILNCDFEVHPTHAIMEPRAFARLFRAGGETVTLDDMESKIKIDAGPLSGSVTTLPADDFPTFGFTSSGMFLAILGLEQLDMILRVAGAVSTEETRYYLNGVYIHHVEGWTYKAVATDGHRLYVGTLELPDAHGAGFGNGSGGGFIIPRRFLNILRKHRPRIDPASMIEFFAARSGPPENSDKTLAPVAEKAGMFAAKAGLSYYLGETKVTAVTKLIDGTFPDYTRVIPHPKDGDKTIVFKARDMKAAIDAITAGANERTLAVKLTFDPNGKCSINCKWVDVGFDGQIWIPATVGVKEPFEIGYNAAYLRSILEVGGGEDMTIRVNDSNSPGVLASPEATDFKTILMPMRV